MPVVLAPLSRKIGFLFRECGIRGDRVIRLSQKFPHFPLKGLNCRESTGNRGNLILFPFENTAVRGANGKLKDTSRELDFLDAAIPRRGCSFNRTRPGHNGTHTGVVLCGVDLAM